MAYTNSGWPTNIPAGSDALNTADDQIRRLRLDLKERLNDIVDDITADPIVLTGLDGPNGRPDLCHALTGALFSLPSSASQTVIDFVNETLDTGGYHSDSVNPSRFTITTAGYYRIHANIAFVPLSTGTLVTLTINKNGSRVADYLGQIDATLKQTLSVSVVDLAAATDFYEVTAIQNSGDTWTTDSGRSAYAMIERLVGST